MKERTIIHNPPTINNTVQSQPNHGKPLLAILKRHFSTYGKEPPRCRQSHAHALANGSESTE
ncbi:MAG: hypothetical protein HC767_12850 [Akkermansiaceae bacterium]|nr:hypothetical protein [Akkermansiaceae bacterium]